MELKIRPARAVDIPGISVLAAETFPLACPSGLPSERIREFVSAQLSEAAFARYLQSSVHTVLQVTLADELTGVAELCGYVLLVEGVEMDPIAGQHVQMSPSCGISKFYIAQNRHGSGVAASAMDNIIATARTRGYGSLWLCTNVQNARARAFYEREGFQERGHRDFDISGFLNTDVIYELPL